MRSLIALGVLSLVSFRTAAQLQPANNNTESAVDRARTLLNEGFDDGDYTVRIQAITSAGMVKKDDALLHRLQGFLADKNVQVRLATVQTLSDFHTPDVAAVLREDLNKEETPEVWFAVAKVLGTWGDPGGTKALINVYDRNHKTRSGVLKREERNVKNQFHSTPSAVVFIVSRGVGYVPVPGAGEGFSAISSLLRDPAISDRASVLLILCRKKTRTSEKLLRRSLKDDDWSVRAVAAQMIAHTAQTDLLDALIPLFDDKNEKVRFRAVGAYLHLNLVAKQMEAGTTRH